MKIAKNRIVRALAVALTVWCVGNVTANPAKYRAAHLTPSKPNDIWIVTLDPAEDAKYDVTIAEYGRVNNVDYVFESSGYEPPFFTKPFFLWVGSGAARSYSFYVVNAEWVVAETTVELKCRWVPDGGGQGLGGGGGPGPIDGSALGDAYAYQAAFIIEAIEQPPIIAVGEYCEVQAFLVDEHGARKPTEADWELGGSGEIEGDHENVDYVLVVRDEPGELPVNAVCCKAPELSDDEILIFVKVELHLPNSDTYAWVDSDAAEAIYKCDVENHKQTITATVTPQLTPPLSVIFKFKENTDTYGAILDASTGVLTPGSEASGKIIVKAELISNANCFDEQELMIKPHPSAVNQSSMLTYHQLAQQVPDDPLLYFLDGSYGGLWSHQFGSTGGSLAGQGVTEWTDDSDQLDPTIVNYPVLSVHRPEQADDGSSWTLQADGWFADGQYDNYMSAPTWLHLDDQVEPLPFRDNALKHRTVQYYHWACPICEGHFPRISGPHNVDVMLYRDANDNKKIETNAYGKQNIEDIGNPFSL